MARVIMSKMIDTFRSFRPSQGNLFTNVQPNREFPIYKTILSVTRILSPGNSSNFSTLAITQTAGFGASTSFLQVGENVQIITTRTNVRCHFPRPSEQKRVKRHGWKTRMSTLPGRRIIMRRILHGRHVLTH
ncbi:hypothetical protein R5R35_000029 [Gryllus longicercus]|uniref:Large ribosomal subunit protein bL34m n=1 Tax=Gryllus longicercus TaxID=2509291 RepID=A0AAN9Z6U9_9ORTH